MPWKRKLKDKRAMRGLWSYSLLSIYLYKSFITSSVTHMYVFNSLLQFPIPFLRYNQRHFKMILLNPKWQKVTWHESLTWMNFQFKHNAFQFSSVAQSCPTLCNPLDYSMPGLPVHHHLPEFTQTHAHWVRDTIQPSHPSVVPFSSRLQSSPVSGSFQMSQLFPSGDQSTGVSASASVLPMNI